MSSRLIALLGLVLLALTIGFASPSMAQASRTWVSGVGDDANPCSRTAPCKTFAGAISKTAANGYINIIDAGGFGSVTVTKSITIAADGPTAGILASSTNGVVINGSGIDVHLIGLSFDGFGTGLNGIRILNAATVTIERCRIMGFTGAGIDFESASRVAVYVHDTEVSNNAKGMLVKPAGTEFNAVQVDSSSFVHNTANIVADGTKAVLSLSDTTVALSSTGLSILNGASISSYGNNRIRNGTPTQTLPLN